MGAEHRLVDRDRRAMFDLVTTRILDQRHCEKVLLSRLYSHLLGIK